MSNTPKLKLSDDMIVEVVDPDNIQPLFADLVTEFRITGDVVYLSLANLVVDGDSPTIRKAHVCARLRIAGHSARLIQRLLSEPAPDQDSPDPSNKTLN